MEQIRLLPKEQDALARAHNVCFHDEILSERHLKILSGSKKTENIFRPKKEGLKHTGYAAIEYVNTIDKRKSKLVRNRVFKLLFVCLTLSSDF